MRILHVAPNHETVPPAKDGGTERVIAELTNELAKRGHEIVLFAPWGSNIDGQVITYPFIGDHQIRDYVIQMLPNNIDIIHDHTFDAAIGRLRLPIPTVCTMHLDVRGEVDYPIYVSRSSMENIGNHYGYYVYNGIHAEDYQFSEQKQDFLLFMGRIVREKGILQALDLAEATGQRLIIAGPIHDELLFTQYITPRLRQNPMLHYIGPVGGQLRQDLLRLAKCLLFPIQWEEPFGLVMIEAMACGTPVLALGRGAVPEIMAGCPEFICWSLEEMKMKIEQFHVIYPPYELRKYVHERFSVERMANNYEELYMKVIYGRFD